MAVSEQAFDAWSAQSEAFGKTTLSASSRLEMNLRLPGQYFDGESRTHYNRFRDYAPATGRYVQKDPIGLLGGWNKLVYVLNGPLVSSDSEGLATVVFFSNGIFSNPAGHIAIATTGGGIYSYGTANKFGSSVDAYINGQLANRNLEMVILSKTTPAQEAAI